LGLRIKLGDFDQKRRPPDYVLARITDGGARRIEAKRTDQTLYDLPPGPERTPAYITPTVYGPPAAVLMNLPQLADDIPAHHPYAAVFAAPWYGSALIWRSPSTDGFTALGTVGQPARIGTLAFDFYPGPVWRFDNGNEFWLDMASGIFASLDNKALLAGRNPLAIETAPGVWEIVQFGTAALQSPGRWKLTHLLRGQFGTEDVIANPAPTGARVVVLNTAVVPVAITESDVGLPANWRIATCQHNPDSMKPSVKPPYHLRVEWLPAMPWNECPRSRGIGALLPWNAHPATFGFVKSLRHNRSADLLQVGSERDH